MSSIIQVTNLSKSFIIPLEGRQRYTALRDVVADKTKNILSGGNTGNTSEEFWALDDVSFTIEKGERVGIIGRNGAGKSTLLKVLSRITEPTKGTVRLKGRVASLLEVGTGFHPELTGRENIFLNGAILGMSRSEIKKKFDEIVSFAEVEKFLDTPVKRYSSGMYVRLAFSVAAHLEPDILVIDEVLAVGDAQFQKKCLGKMEAVSTNEGRTVIFVSHQLGTIAQLCSKTMLLKNGQLQAFDETGPVIQKYVANEGTSAGNCYTAPKNINSPVFFKEIKTTNGERDAEEFGFHEQITVRCKVHVGIAVSDLKIGITLQTIHGNYVSTNICTVNNSMVSDDAVQLSFNFPAGIIAPNVYYFRVAAFQEGAVYEVLENICGIKVQDTGTHLSRYEGINYGSVMFDNNWQINPQ